MKVIDMRTQSEIVPENFERVFATLAHEALAHGELANTFDTKVAFKNNTPDLIVAQNILTANDSTFTLIREEASENKDMFDIPFEARAAKAQAGFKANMNVIHKTIVTRDGKLRGFSTNFDDRNVIQVNFAPNKHNTLKPTG